jgi:hypothetical protein
LLTALNLLPSIAGRGSLIVEPAFICATHAPNYPWRIAVIHAIVARGQPRLCLT